MNAAEDKKRQDEIHNHKIRMLQSKNTDEWMTPDWLFNELNEEFRFNLDAAATDENAKHPVYYTMFDNALEMPWKGKVWCNPPYSKVKQFLAKAHEELQNGNCEVAVFLVFSNTDTGWFHDYVLGKAELRFIKGRVRFTGKNKDGKVVNDPAMRPSMVCVLRRSLYHGISKPKKIQRKKIRV